MADDRVMRSDVGDTPTIGAVWRRAMALIDAGPAYLVEDETGWRPISRETARERVEAIANGLLARGIRHGDAFAILGRTSLEWVLFDFALLLVGAIVVPIYPNESDSQVGFVLHHSDAIGVLIEDPEWISKLQGMKVDRPRHVLAFTDIPALEAEGRAFANREPAALAAAEARVDPHDVFTYVYTSGTTGKPKGCMIRHNNITVLAGDPALGTSNEVVLLHLPVAHLAGRAEHLLGPLAGTIALCPDFSRVYDALKKVCPTRLPTVPRVFEKIYAELSAEFGAEGPYWQETVDWALRVGADVNLHRQRGTPISNDLLIEQRIAERLVYSKVKGRFGGRLRAAGAGGGALPAALVQFFQSCDIFLEEGYGLTECIACTANSRNRFKTGTAGVPFSTTEARIAEDGEILVRGPCVFAGYYKDPEATAAAFTAEGWLLTGDVGHFDSDGFLHITDRKKNILVTAGGKNVAPEPIESDLRSSPFLSQALLLGNGRPFIAALLTLDVARVRAWLTQQGVSNVDHALESIPEVQTLVQSIVDQTNTRYARFQQVKQFKILPREFSLAEGELTPTLKVKRAVCEQHFAQQVEAVYSATETSRG